MVSLRRLARGAAGLAATLGQSRRQASSAVAAWYSIRTGIALNQSYSPASARIGHQS